MAHSEIRSLTGLRGAAAVYVMVYHFAAIEPDAIVAPLSGWMFLHHGYLSLDLFFVLSGFVIALTYHDAFTNRARFGAHGQCGVFAVFLGHRLARLYPLYIILTLLSAAIRLAGVGKPVADFGSAFVANVLMMQAWISCDSLVGTAWSISSEWEAYLALPVLLVVCVSGARWLAGLAGALAASVLVLLATTTLFGAPPGDSAGPLDLYLTTLTTSLRCLSEFCLGLLTYRLYKALSAAHLRKLAWTSPVVLAAMVGTCLWPDLDLVWVALVPVLILGLAADQGVVAGVLGSKPVHQLGVLSYAIYLLAPNMTKFLTIVGSPALEGRVPFGHAIVFTLASASIVMMAYFAHRWIERPGRQWLQHRLNRFEWTRDTMPRAAPRNPTTGALTRG